jgi:4-amino-4-deoxy-L-arabinose transferase-like glycosyltransferase
VVDLCPKSDVTSNFEQDKGGNLTGWVDKSDVVTVIVLCVVFLGIATWNLGLTQTPISTATLSNGQSFYVDLGQQNFVSSVYFLLKDGSFNLTIYSGSPDNWKVVTSGVSFSDYYKWKEVGVSQTAQYLRVDFGSSNPDAIIAEVAATSQGSNQLNIENVVAINGTISDLRNLIDEQNKVELPATYMSQTYFDEIYFVRTAEQYLHLQSPYEWTHPPLGKLIQAAGIVMFGYSPFGWRFMGVIFATAMIPVIYFLGKRLFGTWIGAFAAAFLLTFDFMHFAMGRMGTADTYVVFFSLLSQLCFLIYFSNVIKSGWKTSVLPLFAAVMFFILGFSTKWLVIYGAVGMLALLVVLRIKEIKKLKGGLGTKYVAFFDHPFLLLIGFIALAVGVYFLTYIPDMLTGRPLLGTYGNGVIDLQFAMYNYHATLVATHSFASPWWSWPIMTSFSGYVPLWLDVTYLPNNVVSTISVFGNPAVWWVSIVSMIVLAIELAGGETLIAHIRSWRKNKQANQDITATSDSFSTVHTDSGGTNSEPPNGEVLDQESTLPLDSQTPKAAAASEETVKNLDDSPSVEISKTRNSMLIVGGFAIFVVTAILSELLNYHSFLLALPIYSGMFLALYGMIKNVGEKHEPKDVAPIFIMAIFLFSWIPYTFLSRVTFIYHFYISVPSLCLATAYFISKGWHTRKGKIAAIALFAAVLAMFAAFYPVISGMPAPTSYIHYLKWFPSWFFAP